MPTGYTAGILDGTTRDFTQFAKLCMRAFGATMHLRDENLDAEYLKREPSDYHRKEIDKAKAALNYAKSAPSTSIILNEKERLEKDRDYYIKSISDTKEYVKKLNDFLEKAEAFNPPTKQHLEIKSFMIEQLKSTINFDGSTEFSEKRLSEIESELSTLDSEKIRKQQIDEAAKSLKYHKAEYAKEVARCNDSNNWVEMFLKSVDTPESLNP